MCTVALTVAVVTLLVMSLTIIVVVVNMGYATKADIYTAGISFHTYQ